MRDLAALERRYVRALDIIEGRRQDGMGAGAGSLAAH